MVAGLADKSCISVLDIKLGWMFKLSLEIADCAFFRLIFVYLSSTVKTVSFDPAM
jgi:hypothetical protein